MPSDVIIKMECPSYLIKFLECLYGNMPIVFPRNNDLSKSLDHLLDRPPKSYTEDSNCEGMLLIKLNYFEDKNILYNWYLSKKSKGLFIERVNKYFKCKFHEDVNTSLLNGYNRKDSIDIFIEKFDLYDEKEIYDLLERDYRRYWERKEYRKTHKRKQKKIEKNFVS
jgi:hypothetical protein